MTKRFFNIKELSEYIGISIDTIYFWVYQKSMPSYKIGKHRRFKVEEIEEWLNKRRTIAISFYFFQ
jgi:excisionase family DNA binding protein